ncbi:MAG: hypothetical protein ABI127_06285 [Dokdonella sp.]
MTIKLHIERIVLSGISLNAGQQREFGHALSVELSRLMTLQQRMSATADSEIRRMVAPTITLRGSPKRLGQSVARSLARTLRK